MKRKPLLLRYLGMTWEEVVVRKDYTCWCCGRREKQGSKAWKPITNNKHRMHRLCCQPETAKPIYA